MAKLLNETAESIGTGLGHLQNKYDDWMKQRDAIASELRDYMSSAHKMLADMGHTAQAAVAETKAAVTTVVETRKRVMSEAHKKAISAAATARRAAKEGAAAVAEVVEVAEDAAKKTRNVSPEVRARLSKLAKARWAKVRKAGKTKLG